MQDILVEHANEAWEIAKVLVAKEDDSARFLYAPDVMSRVVDGETVLLDLASGKYFGLDHVGTRAWELIGRGQSLGEIRSAMVAEFQVTEAVVAADLAELFTELAARGLIVRGR